MKNFLVTCFCFLLSGCAGLAVGTFGTFENEQNVVHISDKRNEFEYIAPKSTLTKEVLVSTWGKPDEISQYGKCEVVTYYDGYSWSGIGAFLVFFPVPLMVPTGYDENRFYFINGESVGLVSEYGEVTGALGYMCGSNECKGVAGPVTENKRQIEVRWCG